MTILDIGFREQLFMLAIPVDQGIASRKIHQFSNTLQNVAWDGIISRHIAHPLVMDFIGPMSANCATRREPHEQVALRCRIEYAGIQHNHRGNAAATGIVNSQDCAFERGRQDPSAPIRAEHPPRAYT